MSASSGTSSSSDDYFLNMVRTQMREMNPLRKMRFKQKIFNLLLETFDDATDFPDSGDLQPETTSTVATALTLSTVAKSSATPKAAKPQGAEPNLDERRIGRIVPMVNGEKVPMTILRQDRIARSTPGIATGSCMYPMLVRQMGRRYSVCGGVGPSAALANSQSAAGSVGAVVSPRNGSLEALLKRRLPNVSQSMVPPQQRPRYSQSPTGHIAPGNSLLVRRAAVAGAQKQVSPQGGMPLTQKSPQLSGNTGFNSFATPTTLQRVTSPQKRGMVIANVKGQGQQQAKSSVAAVRAAAPLGQIKSTSSPNVANLLSDSRPNMSNPAQRLPAPAQTSQAATPIAIQSQPHSQPAKAAAAAAAKTAAAAEQREETQTAGIIAADYFDMSRLKREPQDIKREPQEIKREPQDILDDDILGM